MGILQREKEHKEIDFDSARKRLQQNYRQAENGSVLFFVSDFVLNLDCLMTLFFVIMV